MQRVVGIDNLACAALLPTGRLLADLHGRRRIFIAGTAPFTVASLLCALAPSVSMPLAASPMLPAVPAPPMRFARLQQRRHQLLDVLPRLPARHDLAEALMGLVMADQRRMRFLQDV
ncbi:major facilitator transporter domain protein [Burkholderia cepacia]|nr:major facilitator transporter domain protein [Burkholderia cepacia]